MNDSHSASGPLEGAPSTDAALAAAAARVLVVEDDATVADVLREVLQDQGYQITFATTAEDALKHVDALRPDLILTDISLPAKSGIDVMKHARGRDPEVAVILMTGYASVQTAIDALREGASEYITKPFEDIADIPAMIDKHLRNRRLKIENRALLEQLRRQNEVLQRHELELREKVAVATWQMSTLYRVAMDIGEDLELQPRLRRIAEIAAQLLGASIAAVYLQSEDTGEFRCAVAHGAELAPTDEGTPHFLTGSGPLGMTAFNLGPVRHGAPGGRAFELPGLAGSPMHELLAVPMVQGGQATGVLVVADRAEGFDDEHAEFLTLYASQAAVQVRNSQLFEHTKSLDRLKSDFVAVVSHEIRTPLTSVKGALELLSDDRYFKNNDQQNKLLTIALAKAERLLLLINDILDFSKLESASLPMTIERQRLEPVVQQAAQNLRMLLEERRIRLEVEMPADLPDALLDAHRIAQVLTNLLSNAIKFSPSGENIRVTAAFDGRMVRVAVVDHGDGISPQDLPKLFRKFQQIASGSTRKAGGTGLGLVISKGIIEQHGGRIGVDSEPGQGSTFWFTLPADERAVSETAAAA